MVSLNKLIVYFQTSPAASLLRSPNAPFIVDFLSQQFKKAGRITIPHSELHASLTSYQEDIQTSHPGSLRDKAEKYLSDWCSRDTRWLQRLIETEPVYQLTPHTEDVLAFLDRVLDQDFGFVGTDSRLRLVIDALADLVIGASQDPEVRLAHLRGEQLRIQEEILAIEQDGTVNRYQPAQIRERFATAVSLLKQLQGDFRAVEEKFKDITRQVRQRQVEGGHSRGGILEFALDAEDLLKREDQGVSFYEFVRFILSPAQQEKLQTIIRKLGQIKELVDQTEGLETVRRMVPLLLAEAEKVMRTNQRLSTTLRRLLDAKAQHDQQRVGQLLGEILALAGSLSTAPPYADVGSEVETRIALATVFSREFWSEPTRLAAVDLTEHESDDERRAAAFRALAQLHRLDWRRMRDCVRSAVARDGSITLGRLLDQYPPEAGAVEVLAYLQIARDDSHIVSHEATEEILLPQTKPFERMLCVTAPLVTFVPRQA